MASVAELSGYALELLRVGGGFALYRGRQPGSEASILVSAPARDPQTPADQRRLEHEYALAGDLDPAWAARPLSIERRDGRTMLVLEDAGGDLLEGMLGRPIELPRFLQIAIGLAVALREVHRRGLVHKDIRPANVFVDAALRVRLTGFGIASRVPRERQPPAPPETIEGTFAYMAPEQTGRMNRSIDGRSDLYSLGVTLYEMITGKLPFSASDPMEWIHCHIARQPTPPSARTQGIPGPVEAIISRLLAKSAEDRYQTAAGLEADLRRCLAEWEAHGRVEPFPLGMRDVSDRLLLPERLYGREREIETMLAAFDRVVADGATELVLVSGYSGIGKSSVVHELHKALVPPRGLFASGKFDQYKRDVPYATWAQSFQSLVRHILGKGEVELGEWRDALREALGANGGLIVNLVPELELVIGKQPPVADLPPQDAKNRFQLVFRRFLGVFARKEHPLALFLDDLQWLDTATLELLEQLAAQSEGRCLLLIGAYRDNEVGPAHPLLRTLGAIRDAGARVHEIVLSPLRIDDVGQLVADGLHCEPERARPLAQLVLEKTGGNPFFAIQFVTALTEQGLIAFDPVAPAWRWDMDRIRAKGYTDNIVDLMVEKLKRLSAPTQEALKLLACLGAVAEVATLAVARGDTEETIHVALWEAVHAGVVFPEEGAYKFLHDRIQQAAYSLIPEQRRAAAHLRIGRALLAGMTADQFAEHLFDVANQLNRGVALLADRDEKVEAATIDLRAGRKAKASAAYVSANVYLAAAMALLDETYWATHYELMFSLGLERAECEFLTAKLDAAEQLVGELLPRAASKLDQAAVYQLKILVHTVKSENPLAVAAGLACLRLFGADIPANPTWEQVEAEYELLWQNLDGRSIESLIELPLMTDPEQQAATRLISTLSTSAYFTDFHLFCLLVCRIANISMQHGVSGASAHGCAYVGFVLGPFFHRYGEDYRFAELACKLVEKHGFAAYQAKVYHITGTVAFWTRSISTGIGFKQAAVRAAVETGDLTFACIATFQSITGLLLRGDPLDAVWSEAERAMDFVRRAKYRVVADSISTQQHCIAKLQGRTASFSTFTGSLFDETAFEAQLEGRTPTIGCLYWIVKLRMCFLSGDYVEALAAADKAKPILWASTIWVQFLDYSYYSALTMAALYPSATADEQNRWRELLTEHREELREWAENFPPTFADKHALVSAEIARIEGRELDAERLYEQAIRLARDHDFAQNEALAYEMAAGFYMSRGFETFANAYRRNARSCYLRWGAHGKVRQLDRLYPHLAVAEGHTATIGSIQQLDVASIVKASQALSGEIELPKLIERLMTIALENAGADRGLLILPAGEDYLIQAQGQTTGDRVEVLMRQTPISRLTCPDSLLRYVIRTRESVIIGDASRPNPFSEDEYLRGRQPRSILCLPLIKQGRLTGLLYLENGLTSHAFTPDRIAVLELLAAQAAISLENTRLYSDLQEREAKVRRLVDSNIVGIYIWDFQGRIIDANDAFLEMVGYSREDLVSGRLHYPGLTPSEWDDVSERARTVVKTTGTAKVFEKEYLRKDGSRVPILLGGATFGEGREEGVAFVLDLTERKQAEENLLESERRYREAQAQLAHVNRVTTMGQLTASIAHEINQPLAGIASNGAAGLNWLNREKPDLDQARGAFSRIVKDSARTSGVIRGLRALVKKSDPQLARLDIDDVIREVLALTTGELRRHGVALQTDLAAGDRPVLGDRVQLQQVLLNLIMNGVDAMRVVTERTRELMVSSTLADAGSVLVSVEDTGTGLDPAVQQRIFEPFFTTKSEGLGMGLSICRSIVERHRGRLWASPRVPHGAAIRFTVPAELTQ
jgi:PAS domain S-box-containing protein